MRRTGFNLLLVIFAISIPGGCAFDIVQVRQVPVTFSSSSVDTSAPKFLLTKPIAVSLGTGFPTRLKAGTTWTRVGTTEFGEVYSTTDQVVNVEASNVYEGYIVVSNRCLTGFYLPVEKTFSPVPRVHPLEINDNP